MLEFGTKNPSHDSGLFHRDSRILLDPTALLQGTSQRATFQSPVHELHHKSYQPDQKDHTFFFPKGGEFVFGWEKRYQPKMGFLEVKELHH